jgi:NAD/NADP transhydrogenase beta subunit
MTDAARRILLGILVLGVIGISAELLLLSHTEHWNQWIPLVLNDITIAMCVVVAFKPTTGTIRLFQLIMLLMIISGGVGMYLHLQANMEFQREMDATLSGWALLKKSVVAKAPPALAPGAMTQLGLIGLAYTFRHPALGTRRMS